MPTNSIRSGQDARNIIAQGPVGLQQPTARTAPAQEAPPSVEAPLPYMAVGRTDAGEAYYGEGLLGWAKGIYGRMFDPSQYRGADVDERDEQRLEDVGEFFSSARERLPFINQLHPGIGLLNTVAGSNQETPESQEMLRGLQETARNIILEPSMISDFAKQAIKQIGGRGIFMGGFSLGELPFRKAFSVFNYIQDEGADMEEIADRGQSVLPDLPDFLNKIPVVGAMMASYNYARAWTGNAPGRRAFDIPNIPEIVRAEIVGDRVTGDAASSRLAAYLDASDMVYTSWLDEAKRYDAIRRIESGEAPANVTEELANPWIELAGSLAFDAFNIFDIAGLGKAGRAERLANAAQDFFARADDMNDIRKAAQAGNDIQAAGEVTNAIRRLADSPLRRVRNFARMATDYRLLSGTADARRYITGKRMGMIANGIWQALSAKPEDAIEAMADLVRWTDADAGVRAAAAARLARSPAARMIFSNAGMDYAAVLRRVMDNTGGIDKLMDAVRRSGNVADLAKEMAPVMARTLDSMFPRVDEMLDAVRKVEKGKDVTESVRRVADMWNSMAPTARRWVQFLNAVERKVSKPYRVMNTFFSYVYMGYNPGYAFRNLLTDTVTFWAEEGAVAATKGLGERLLDTFGRGAGRRRAIAQAANVLGESADDIAMRYPDLFKGFGPHAGESTAGRPFGLRLAEAAEAGTSASIANLALRREMNRALRSGMLPDIDGMFQAIGGSAEDANLYRDIFMRNWGNVGRTNREFLDAIANGTEETWRRTPLFRELKRFLGHFSGADEVLESIARTARTPDEFEQMIADFKQSYHAAARGADNEIRGLQQVANEGAELIGPIERGAQRGLFNGQAVNYEDALFRARRQATNNAITYARSAAEDALNRLKAAGIDTGDLWRRASELRNGLDDAHSYVRDFSARCIDDAWIVAKDAVENGRPMSAEWYDRTLRSIVFSPPGTGVTETIQDIPANLDYETFTRVLLDFWRPRTREGWRLTSASYSNSLLDSIRNAVQTRAPQLAPEIFNENWTKATASLDVMDAWYRGNTWDEVNNVFSGLVQGRQIPEGVSLADIDVRSLIDYGFHGGRGRLLNMVNADRRAAGLVEAGSWAEVPFREAIDAAIRRGELKPLIHSLDAPPTQAMIMRQGQGFMEELIDAWAHQVKSSWGQTRQISTNPRMEGTLRRIEEIVTPRLAEARTRAVVMAQSERDWILHDYGDKRYFDLAMSHIFPYQFWYSRSYPKWMVRLAENPQIVARYADYRRMMEQMHAGLPDWWKYNLSTNDIPGVDMENPMYFNLEATLNPLNGLTGVDFDDPLRRTTWYSRALDDMGKYGPSVWTPLQWIVAAKLYANGEEEAAGRWMGRLIPATAQLKGLLWKAGARTGLFNDMNEFDPFVSLFHGGLDPYERRRVGRALGAMVDEGLGPAVAQEAAYSQEGDVWAEAVRRSQEERLPGSASSFFFGVGFKGRTQSDIEIDNFFSDYSSLMQMRPNLSPLEFRDAMTRMREQYPFMDTVLISRRGDDERRSAYAYSVMTRIPPGQLTELGEISGIDSALINSFYENKGDFAGWTPGDVDRFMAGIVDMGAILEIPDSATQYEWNAARDAYQQMRSGISQSLGVPVSSDNPDGIWGLVDQYYRLEGDERRQFVEAYPEVEQALDMQTQMLAFDPLLYQYYGGIETLNRYYTNQMYDVLEERYGGDTSALWDQYYNLTIDDALYGTNAARAFYNQNRTELRAYSADRDAMQADIDRRVADLAGMLPETPQVQPRQVIPQGPTQEALYESLGQAPMTWEDWQQVLSPSLQRLLVGWRNGERLPSAVTNRLNYMASDYGFGDGSEMLQAIGSVIPR